MKTDFVARLMEITASGYHAEIVYRKGGIEGESRRVIEPRKLVDGANGLMIRAVQIKPEPGLRTFSVHKIVEVAKHDLALDAKQRAGNNFCTGEVVAFSTKSVHFTEAESPIPPFQSAWSQAWFHRYVGVVRQVLLDMELSEDEIALVRAVQVELGLSINQIRAAHSYVVGEELLAMSVDGTMVDHEHARLVQVATSLRRLGYSPLVDC